MGDFEEFWWNGFIGMVFFLKWIYEKLNYGKVNYFWMFSSVIENKLKNICHCLFIL